MWEGGRARGEPFGLQKAHNKMVGGLATLEAAHDVLDVAESVSTSKLEERLSVALQRELGHIGIPSRLPLQRRAPLATSDASA